MLSQIITRLFIILFYNPVEILELLFATLMMCTGTFLMLPLHTFDSAPTVYAIMSSLMNEHSWGRIFLMIGLLKMYGLIFQQTLARAAGGMCTTCMFSFMAASFLLSNPSSMGTVTFGILALFQWWTTLMVLHKARPKYKHE